MKAYLPRWVLWVIIPMLGLMWTLITYSVFGTASGREEIGLVGWVLITLVFVLVGGMMWLMGSGRLPAYVIELEDTEEPEKR